MKVSLCILYLAFFDKISNGFGLKKINRNPFKLNGTSASKSNPSESKFKLSLNFASKNSFVLGLAGVVSLAKLFPKIGCTGGLLKPEIYVLKYGVSAIFLLTGLKTKLIDLRKVLKDYKLICLIQTYNLFFLPIFGIVISEALKKLGMTDTFSSGIKVLMCLPTTISMCVVLSQAAGGSVSGTKAALNAVICNLLGIFISPALILYCLPGASRGDVSIAKKVLKLGQMVLLPVTLGLLLQNFKAVKDWQIRQKQLLTKFSEIVLLAIVYNTFCDAFLTKANQNIISSSLPISNSVFLLPLSLLFIQIFALASTALVAKLIVLPKSDLPVLMFCGSQKTLAFGIPLLSTMLHGTVYASQIAAITTPLLIFHPMQLIIGGLLVPKLKKYIKTDRQSKLE